MICRTLFLVIACINGYSDSMKKCDNKNDNYIDKIIKQSIMIDVEKAKNI